MKSNLNNLDFTQIFKNTIKFMNSSSFFHNPFHKKKCTVTCKHLLFPNHLTRLLGQNLGFPRHVEGTLKGSTQGTVVPGIDT